MTNDGVTFDVLGLPAPKGSGHRFANGGWAEGSNAAGSARIKAWASAVADEARAVAERLGPFAKVALVVGFEFRFSMIASAPKSDRERGYRVKSTKPDIDKLERTTLDALTAGGLIGDDALVALISHSLKIEVADGWTGATIRVEPWSYETHGWRVYTAPTKGGPS